jgi:iron only hydrogenase large subunit-like protein
MMNNANLLRAARVKLMANQGDLMTAEEYKAYKTADAATKNADTAANKVIADVHIARIRAKALTDAAWIRGKTGGGINMAVYNSRLRDAQDVVNRLQTDMATLQDNIQKAEIASGGDDTDPAVVDLMNKVKPLQAEVDAARDNLQNTQKDIESHLGAGQSAAVSGQSGRQATVSNPKSSGPSGTYTDKYGRTFKQDSSGGWTQVSGPGMPP